MTLRRLFYTPTGPLRAVWRFSLFLVLLIVAVLLLGRVAGAIARPETFAGRQFFGFSIMLAAVAFAQFVMLRLVEKRPWSEIGLGAAQAAPRFLGFGLALGGLGILLPSLGLMAAHWLVPAAATAASGTTALFAVQMVALILPQSLAEELVSRGYAFAAIREGAGPVVAVAVTSAAFGALHLLNPGVDAQSLASVVLAGVFLGMLVIVTGSVYAAWMAHFAWNFVIVAVLHAKVSGVAFPRPGYTLTETGPAWITGGAWGPEGGAAACAGMLAAIAALAWWRRGTNGTAALELSNG